MFVDGRQVPDGSELHPDVCIVGAGPAGLALALELLRSPCGVLIVESGGLRRDPKADRLSRLGFESPDFDSPNAARRRRFGGMATAWDAVLPTRRTGARHVPLDPIDFERRPWVPFSGWPFPRSALAPFYERAHRLLGLGPFVHDPEEWEGDGLVRIPLRADALTTTISQFVPRELFTTAFRQVVATSRTTTAILHANVVGLETDEDGRSVTIARVRCVDGPSFSVRARFFVIAAGAIENARLLLLSTRPHPGGLGNDHGVVGRYFMEHPTVLSGILTPHDARLFERLGLYDIRRRNGTLIAGRLQVAEAVMRGEQILNGGVSLVPRLREADRAALGALRRLARAARAGRLPPDARGQLRSLLPALGPLASTVVRLGLWQGQPRPTLGAGGWSHLGRGARRFGALALVHHPEQAPDPENRVVLGDGTDALGLRIARLRWRWSELDLRSIRRIQELLAAEFERAGLGVVERDPAAIARGLERAGHEIVAGSAAPATPWLLRPGGAHHHLGTTRMHHDPEQGVVDERCRVHGVGNLFVAGGSVFPTGGYANPTLTIVALAIRLADHLRGLLAGP